MMGELSETADPPKELDSMSERLCVFVLPHATFFVKNITDPPSAFVDILHMSTKAGEKWFI